MTRTRKIGLTAALALALSLVPGCATGGGFGSGGGAETALNLVLVIRDVQAIEQGDTSPERLDMLIADLRALGVEVDPNTRVLILSAVGAVQMYREGDWDLDAMLDVVESAIRAARDAQPELPAE